METAGDAEWLLLREAAELLRESPAAFLILVQRGALPQAEWRKVQHAGRWVWRRCWRRLRLELAAMGRISKTAASTS